MSDAYRWSCRCEACGETYHIYSEGHPMDEAVGIPDHKCSGPVMMSRIQIPKERR